MPPIEEQNTGETEKVVQGQPETGADNTPATIQEPAADDERKPGETPDNELAKWKAMSRKNEKQAEANLKQMQQVQAELAQVKADNARMVAKNTYPQVTDKVFEVLYKGDNTPEDIADFAKSYAELNPITEEKPAVKEYDHNAVKTALLAENPQGTTNPKPKRGDAYKRSQERQNARRRNRNKQTK